MGHNLEYSEDMGYVNIHGQDVKVYVCDKTGRILVPIDELKDMGFRIYKKSQYSRLLIDDNQFNKEFDMYMLQSAQTYMLEKKIGFKENDIIESIKKCKIALTGSPSQTSSSFTSNHFIETKPDENIVVHTTLRAPSPQTAKKIQNDKAFRGLAQHKTEPPVNFNDEKTPPKNFGSSNGIEDRITQNRSYGSSTSPNVKLTRSFPKKIEQNTNNFDQRKGKSSANEKLNIEDFRSRGKQETSIDISKKTESFEVNNSFEKNSLKLSSSDDSLTKSNDFGRGGNNKQKRRSEMLDSPVEKLNNITLDEKSDNYVVVSFIEKSNCLWVQDINNADVLLQIDNKIKEEVDKQKIAKEHVYNKIYLAPEDGLWYRCKIIKFNPFTVFFVDYGNTAQISEIKEASKELSAITAQAVRITFNENQYKPSIFDKIKIRIKKRFDTGTYSVDVINETNSSSEESPSRQPVPAQPTVQTFFVKPPPLYKPQNGDRVMVISHSDGKLAVRSKESYDKLKQIERSLSEEESKLKSVDKVEKGQLILCKKDKWRRAVVEEVQSNAVHVEFLDYHEKMKVDLSALRHINDPLAKQHITYTLTPVVKGYDVSSESVLQELANKQAKGIVVLSNGDFDLKMGEELLSDKLRPQVSDRPMISTFKKYKPNLGKAEYVLNSYCDSNNIYFSSGEALEDYINIVIKTEIDDDNPYEPVVGEVCLGFYQDIWCRCVILSATKDKYEGRFVDFGNSEQLGPDQLRKLPDDGKEAPLLAFRCQLKGLPRRENIEEQLKELLSEGDTFEIDIKKFNVDFYEIEVPSLHDKL